MIEVGQLIDQRLVFHDMYRNSTGQTARIGYPLPLSSIDKIIIKLHLPGKARLIFNYNALPSSTILFFGWCIISAWYVAIRGRSKETLQKLPVWDVVKPCCSHAIENKISVSRLLNFVVVYFNDDWVCCMTEESGYMIWTFHLENQVYRYQWKLSSKQVQCH